MKKYVLILFVLSGFISHAQKTKRSPMPVEGYWVVESNISNPRSSTIFFYNNDAILIYKNSVERKRVNIKRKRIVNQLNEVLRQSIIAWNKEQAVKDNHMTVKKDQ